MSPHGARGCASIRNVTIHTGISILVSILPVLVFLLALILLDSFKLVGFRSVTLAIGAGVVAALVCYFANTRLMAAFEWNGGSYNRYAAPVLEETVKAAYIVYLIHSKRIGFFVDAAIYGFALGAGFAIIENLQCIAAMPGATAFIWIIRGFGTAVMHGGATALFGVLSKGFLDRHDSASAAHYLPGLLFAFVIHSAYNHFFLSPALSAAGIMILLPVAMFLIFHRSERSLRHWLGISFDTDQELYEMLTTGDITQSKTGRYLMSLKDHFPREVVADMFCMLRLHLELSIRAKGVLLMRQSGFEPPPDPRVKETFEELEYLERNVGTTGRFAVMPLLRWSSRDLWQLYMLGK
jgi:RsiW-degrading membrane proteinase PrsW (M82 family)